MRVWLTRKRGRPDEDSLWEVLEPLTKLAELLNQASGNEGSRSAPKTPIDLMQAMVEVRNKTTGHHAYGPDFWAANVEIVGRASDWMRETSPPAC